MKLSKIEIVSGILALLNHEDYWCKGAFARDAFGNRVDPWSKEASSFCIFGAARRVCGLSEGKLDTSDAWFWGVMRDIAGSERISDFNDSHTYVEVVTRLNDVLKAAYVQSAAEVKALA